jgi:hypothetical protein
LIFMGMNQMGLIDRNIASEFKNDALFWKDASFSNKRFNDSAKHT